MDSFGPNVTLANYLLAKGERKIVFEYFDLCRRFWAKHPDTSRLDKKNNETRDRWKNDIENGRMPEFGANLSY
jgi:hypothetical protein